MTEAQVSLRMHSTVPDLGSVRERVIQCARRGLPGNIPDELLAVIVAIAGSQVVTRFYFHETISKERLQKAVSAFLAALAVEFPPGTDAAALVAFKHYLQPEDVSIPGAEDAIYARSAAPLLHADGAAMKLSSAGPDPAVSLLADDDVRAIPLRNWNEQAQENQQNAVVTTMLLASMRPRAAVDVFATWLLAAAGAVGSFLIVNAEKVLPVVGPRGFLTCGLLICASCALGLLSKLYGLRAHIQIETGDAVRASMLVQLKAFEREEKKIVEGARFWGISLDTGFRLDRVLDKYFATLPSWLSALARRQMKPHLSDPQIGFLMPAQAVRMQILLSGLQALAFLAFLVSGFIAAAANA